MNSDLRYDEKDFLMKEWQQGSAYAYWQSKNEKLFINIHPY